MEISRNPHHHHQQLKGDKYTQKLMCKRLALCIAIKGSITVSAQGSAGGLKYRHQAKNTTGSSLTVAPYWVRSDHLDGILAQKS